MNNRYGVLVFTELTSFFLCLLGFSNSVSDMFRRKPIHPYGECVFKMNWLFSCSAHTNRLNLVMLYFTDQGKVWKRMQGVCCMNTLNLLLLLLFLDVIM